MGISSKTPARAMIHSPLRSHSSYCCGLDSSKYPKKRPCILQVPPHCRAETDVSAAFWFILLWALFSGLCPQSFVHAL